MMPTKKSIFVCGAQHPFCHAKESMQSHLQTLLWACHFCSIKWVWDLRSSTWSAMACKPLVSDERSDWSTCPCGTFKKFLSSAVQEDAQSQNWTWWKRAWMWMCNDTLHLPMSLKRMWGQHPHTWFAQTQAMSVGTNKTSCDLIAWTKTWNPEELLEERPLERNVILGVSWQWCPLLSLNLCITTNFTCCLLAKRKKEHLITFIMIIFWDLPQRCLQMTLWHWSCCVIFLWTIPLWLTWRVVVVFHFTRSQICAVSYQRLHHALMLSFWAHMAVTCLTCHDEWLMSKMLEVQLAFHEEQVCTCGQLEVQLSQQHGRLWKDLQQPSWQHCKCPHQQAGLFNTSKRCSESNAVSIHCASVPTTLYTLCCTWSFA